MVSFRSVATTLLLALPLVFSQNTTIPAEFPPPAIRAPFSATYNLTLILPKHTINNTNAGVLLPLADTQSEPKLLLTPTPPSTSKFLLFFLDADQPGFGIVLHQLKINLSAGPDGTLAVTPARTDPSTFFPPGPGRGTGPHRYTFIVYEQPAGFALPPGFNGNNRISFNLANFERQTRIVPVAGQFYRTETR